MKPILISLMVTGIVLISGCQTNDEENLLEDRKDDGYVYVDDSTPENQTKDINSQEAARHLAKLASGVKGVHDATAVVLGGFVVVGIDVDKDVDRGKVGVTKYSVAEALKHDPYGKQAVVVADADGTERIKRVREKASEGHPIQALTDELSDIVGRYMPEGPAPENQADTPDSNKGEMSDKEKNELEEIEKKQSKED
ncbi:YhcN/YlaJ family sporulation lipoprotein [Thalassobacillus sp. CUG 92003]|uniref:YhcN/YlaJ family sporulation lipoprotein n=1 Tax=Thalassobacillus sp. CUG 92003 TaxID=2736641 RepID=UPI0015E6FEE8|nr:YhcN/YlaJ family sporulation lipoprotein [Thalassobacillus sp. CUG 92003]